MPTGRIPSQFAHGGDKTTLPNTDANGYVNWQDGYTPDYERRIGTDMNAKAMERAKHNFLFGLITENLKQWQDQAFPDWRGASVGTENQSYAINSVVRYTVNNNLYRAIQLVPAGTAPTNTSYWELLPTVSWITSISPMPAGGGDPAKEIVTTTGTNANNYLSGTWEFSAPAAAGTANLPNSAAGMLQSKAWTVSSVPYRAQRWTSVDGTEWNRSLNNTAWSAWERSTRYSEVAATGLFGVIPINDCNAPQTVGFYSMNASTANKPWAGSDGGFMLVLGRSGSPSECVQVAIRANASSALAPYIRYFYNGGAGAWYSAPAMSNIPMPAGGFDGGPQLITTGRDFDGIGSGTYQMTATAAAGSPHSPTPNACMIEVLWWSDSGNRVVQRVTELGSGQQYHRVYTPGKPWTSWITNYTSANKPTYDDVGAVPRTTPSNWADRGVVDNVIGMLSWRNHGNGHVIFDASKGKSPSGSDVDKRNPTNPWGDSFPTLMGWNGVATYGVRVDSARVADTANTAGSATLSKGWYLENTSATADGRTLWPISLNSGDLSRWYRLCTLPASNDKSFDSMSFIGSVGPWTGMKGNFHINVGSRGGFHWSGDSGGVIKPIFGAWRQSDNTIIVAIMLNPYWTANFVMEWMLTSGIVPEVAEWTPVGTNVWNSGAAGQEIGRRWSDKNLPFTVDQYNGISFPANAGWTGDNFAQFGPNTSYGGTLIVGGGEGHVGPAMGSVRISDGTMHLDAGTEKPIWLNWESGSGIVFGNAAKAEVGRINKSGNMTINSVAATEGLSAGTTVAATRFMSVNGTWWRDNVNITTVTGARSTGALYDATFLELPNTATFVPVVGVRTTTSKHGFHWRTKFGTYGTGNGGWDQKSAAIWCGSSENDSHPHYMHLFNAYGQATHARLVLDSAMEVMADFSSAQLEHYGSANTWKSLRKIYTNPDQQWTFETVRGDLYGWAATRASNPQTVYMNASNGSFWASRFNCTGLNSSYSQSALSGTDRTLYVGNPTLTDVQLYGNASATYWLNRNGVQEAIATRQSSKTVLSDASTKATDVTVNFTVDSAYDAVSSIIVICWQSGDVITRGALDVPFLKTKPTGQLYIDRHGSTTGVQVNYSYSQVGGTASLRIWNPSGGAAIYMIIGSI